MDIKQGIVGVLNSDGEIVGTGFLTTKNTILTCSHVINQTGSDRGGNVTIRFAVDGSQTTSHVDYEFWSPTEEYDVALLRINRKPDSAKPLPIGKSSGTSGNEFRTFGYASVGGVQGLGARGEIVERVKHGDLLEIRSQDIDRGFSGAPILDETRRVVVGMITWGKISTLSQRNRDTTFGITTEAIGRVFPAIKIKKFTPWQYFNTLKNQWLGITIILLALFGAAALLYFGLRPKQKPVMTGEFRIAIASFDEHGKDLKENIGYTIADGINIRLVDDLQEITVGPKVEIWGPEIVGTITGETAQERTGNASSLAKEIQAYMVIYGVVEETPTGMNVTPEFYLDSDGFYEGSEVIGQYQLGAAFSLPRANNPAWSYDFNLEMTRRSDIISSVATGLSYFAIHDYEKALEIFQNVDQEIEWPKNDRGQEQGKEVLYALIGFSAGKAGQYEITETALEKAVALDPDYSRPYIGIANLKYILALQPFEESKNPADVDQDLLDQCFHYLDLAVQAPEKPPLAEVDTKIHFSRGQCFWLKAYTGQLPDFQSAFNEFQAVIAAYDVSNPSVREMAAESHARIGLIYNLTENPTAAIEEYRMAIDLLPDFPERQAHLHSLIGLIYQTDGNLSDALIEYQKAADLVRDIPEKQRLYQKSADEIQELIQ